MNGDSVMEYHMDEELPRSYPYDACIKYCNRYYLIEFDGIQHFEYTPHFHKDENTFYNRVSVDMYKNKLALHYNIPLLRISYLELDYIERSLRSPLFHNGS